MLGVFYEVETPARFAQGNPGRAQVGAGASQGLALGGCFVAMELQGGVGDQGAGGLDLFRCGVDHQQHRRDEGRQAACQFGGTLGRDVAWAFLVKNETHRVGAGCDHGVHVGLTGEATDLDPRTRVHGNQSYAGVRSGRPQRAS